MVEQRLPDPSQETGLQPLLIRERYSFDDLLEEPIPSPARRFLPIIFGVGAVLVLGVVLHREVSLLLQWFLRWCTSLGWAAPFLLALLAVVLQLFMMPTLPLMVGAGVVFPKMFGFEFGQVVGVVSVGGGIWLGSMLAFWFGRTYFKEWAERELAGYAWMDIINSMVEEQGWWVVLLARASPLLPMEVFNYACSLTSLTAKSYAVGCVGCVVPVALWVCSTASAVDVLQQAAQDDHLSAASVAAPLKKHASFLVANVLFLAMLSVVLFILVRKYSEKVNKHVDRALCAVLSEHCMGDAVDVQDLRRRMTRGVRRMPRRRNSRIGGKFTKWKSGSDGVPRIPRDKSPRAWFRCTTL